MKTRLYLDCRHLNVEGKAPLKLGISRAGETAYIPLGITLLPAQWNARTRRLESLPPSRFPQRAMLENYISRRRTELEAQLYELELSGRLHQLSAVQIRDLLLSSLHPDERAPAMLLETFRELVETKKHPETRAKYECTMQKVSAWLGQDIPMESLTPQMLTAFGQWLLSPAGGVRHPNTVNLHYRFLRSCYNFAIANGRTTYSPFRQFKVRFQETDKRSLTTEQLRHLIALPLEGRAAEYRDIFLLSFLLLGINMIDLLRLSPSSLSDGRIHYRRAKTGRRYSVRVCPEAQSIIDRYRGTSHLLSPLDRFARHEDYNQWCNDSLHLLVPDLTTYWARHSWATIAYNDLRIPTDTISEALGHSHGSRITAVYINPALDLVDEANRRVIDWVWYGKR